MVPEKEKTKKKMITVCVTEETSNMINGFLNNTGMRRSQFIRSAIDEKLLDGANGPLCNQTVIEMIDIVQGVQEKLSETEYKDLMNGLDQILMAQGRSWKNNV